MKHACYFGNTNWLRNIGFHEVNYFVKKIYWFNWFFMNISTFQQFPDD